MDYTAAAVSIRAIATGLMSLADALEARPDVSPKPGPVEASSSSGPSEDDEAPPPRKKTPAKDKEDPTPEAENEPADYDLAQIQAMGRDLLAAKKRSELRAILERFSLPNLSSAKPKQFEKLGAALAEALATE